MKEKKLRVIVTFENMSDAMNFERILKTEKVEGRLIPIPREISSGCGVVWCSDIELKKRIAEIIEKNELCIGRIHEIFR